jgi:hypothetical protein
MDYRSKSITAREFTEAVRVKSRLSAIKTFRELTGLSLKESKDVIDVVIPPMPWQDAAAQLARAAERPTFVAFTTDPDEDFGFAYDIIYRGMVLGKALEVARKHVTANPKRDVIVARIVAETVTTRTLKEV